MRPVMGIKSASRLRLARLGWKVRRWGMSTTTLNGMPRTAVPSDLEIAQAAQVQPIGTIAAR